MATSISEFRRSKKKYAMFPGTEDIHLDRFQHELLSMITNASSKALSQFFVKKHGPLLQFLLRLYLLSLTKQHPDRGRLSKTKNKSNQSKRYTFKEHKIISEWANILTTNEEKIETEAPNVDTVNNVDNLDIQRTKPVFLSKTSSLGFTELEIDLKNSPKAVLSKSNGAFSTLFRHRMTENNINLLANLSEINPLNPRRDSAWNGVLGKNDIITLPAVPKWRSTSSTELMIRSEDSLLNCIICAISKNDNYANHALMNQINSMNAVLLCSFLPFLCVMSTKLKNQNFQKKMQKILLNRIINDDDIKQNFQFFLNSYKDHSSLLQSFKKMNSSLMKKHKTMENKNEKFELRKKQIDALSKLAALPMEKNEEKMEKNEPQSITQTEAESAIYLFLSIFKSRKNLAAGSEIKLCKESKVRDPMNCGAPYLSRIEIRNKMQTHSKPYFCDLYVSNRSDNYFEYLSSTVLLKKGDDLRRDIAVLHCFKFMNKVWRENGLSFKDKTVYAMTYECTSISPNCGIIQIIEGCKPLRLISSISESNISLSQQFNLVASAIGSYMAAFVMGVRDRHFDNVLIRQSDCTLFHIDFGFVLGITPSVDTSKFAITNDLKSMIGSYWNEFVEIGVQSYLILRDKHLELIKYAQFAFAYIYNEEAVETFIKEQLHIDDMNDVEAAKYIAKKLKESPNSTRTKFKNVVHKIATRTRK